MDEALLPLIEMHGLIRKAFNRTFTELSQDEIDWRPLPVANNISIIVRHLRIEAEWHLDSLERGAPMPGAKVTPEVQHLIDSVGMDFNRNLKELEDLFTRFVAHLREMTPGALKERSALAYHGRPGDLPAHLLGFHQAIHLAGHLGQISTIRNQYRKTRGEPGFFPDNPTYPK